MSLQPPSARRRAFFIMSHVLRYTYTDGVDTDSMRSGYNLLSEIRLLLRLLRLPFFVIFVEHGVTGPPLQALRNCHVHVRLILLARKLLHWEPHIRHQLVGLVSRGVGLGLDNTIGHGNPRITFVPVGFFTPPSRFPVRELEH